MEKNLSHDALENRLQSEKLNVPLLSDAYKDQLAQKVLAAASEAGTEKKVISILPLRYFVLAALVVLSFGLFFINQPKDEVQVKPTPVVKNAPSSDDMKALALLAEKFNPDQLGDYANYVLTADIRLNDKYQAEFRALGTISNKIVNSFYDDFKPAKKPQEN